MRVFVTGLCTLHWGRLQYGNIGNYYIIEPLFRELHRIFPEAEVMTTFQMTEDFVQSEKITVLPMELYYTWREEDVDKARWEYESICDSSKQPEKTTDYLTVVQSCDLLINFSGDMWGDNAEHVGHNRFLVDLYKMRAAQKLGVKTVLFAGTPGPFTDDKIREFAKEVYRNFDMVINREPTSTKNMKNWGFVSDYVCDYACPAFLYEPELNEEEAKIVESCIPRNNRKNVGFTVGGFNMPVGPYDMWPRDDAQYAVFADVIEHIINDLDANVMLISHTNGFELPPDFKLINGRDYPILAQLKEIVLNRGNLKRPEDFILLKGPFLPKMTKSIIGKFDMMITGRVHASVAAISQYVPTVFLTYEQKWMPSTKMYGFSSLAGVEEFVCEPADEIGITEKVDDCYYHLSEIKSRLEINIPVVKQRARNAFDAMKILVEDEEKTDK